jgi:hypothetical protein
MNRQKIYSFVFIFLIVALGLFLRAYRIDSVPPGIYPDEAVNGEDALRANATGNYQWFYPANQGREGLFMNLIAFCFKIWGASALTLKLPAILFGTLTVLGTYLLSGELFRLLFSESVRRKAALAAAFMVATSFWALNFSRISFRANMLPAILAFSFFFLWKGLRTKKSMDFVWGGLVFGLGLHSYIAFRIAPAILLVTLFSLLLTRQDFWREYWKKIVIFIASAILVGSPMFYTFYLHPEYLESRSNAISVFSPEVNQGRLAQTFLNSLSLSLLKYTFVGDMNWRHNYKPYPLLEFVAGAAFLMGIFWSFRRFLQTLFRRFWKKIKNSEMDAHFFLISWFFAMLAPEFLTAEGNPHALRSLGTVPVVFIFSALAFGQLLERAERRGETMKRWSGIMIVLALAFSGIFNTVKYFDFWAMKPEVAQSFNRNLTLISSHIQTLPAEKHVYVITGYNTLEKLPMFIFNSERPNTSYLFVNQIDRIQPGNQPFEIILTGYYADALSVLKQKHPELVLKEMKDPLESVYYILK